MNEKANEEMAFKDKEKYIAEINLDDILEGARNCRLAPDDIEEIT